MKKWLEIIKAFVLNLFGFVRSVYKMTGNTERPISFRGFMHFYFAKKYAIKRFKAFKIGNDLKHRHQGIFYGNDQSLMVLSELEMKLLKKRGIVHHPKSYRKLFKKLNYFSTVKMG